MIVGFKPRFVQFVRDGSKQHTLRDERAGDRQIVVGDRLDLYEKVRQKGQTLLGRYLCTRVQIARFELWEGRGAVMYIDGVELAQSEADGFAWLDGFRHPNASTIKLGCFPMMMRYWIEDGKQFPFEKRLLHWDYTKPISEALMASIHPKRRKRP